MVLTPSCTKPQVTITGPPFKEEFEFTVSTAWEVEFVGIGITVGKDVVITGEPEFKDGRYYYKLKTIPKNQ